MTHCLKNYLLLPLAVVWASPYTVLGLMIGAAGLCTGGKVRFFGRAIEFYGGGIAWFVRRLPLGELTIAFTLGHTILGQTAAGLEYARHHEWVHVRQFERWGPLMGPAYLGCSLALWLRGRNAYLDNPFEREAYASEQDRA